MEITLFWHRRDLRTADNAGLYYALSQQKNVQPIFIFDRSILDHLESNDFRVPFIHSEVEKLKKAYEKHGSDLWVFEGKPLEVFKEILQKHHIKSIYTNHDYEPSAQIRDQNMQKLAENHKATFHTFKDQVIFEKEEVLTDARKPYTVFTPYKKKWLASVSEFYLKSYPVEKYFKNLHKTEKKKALITLKALGFEEPTVIYPNTSLSAETLKNYAETRDFPALDSTSRLGLHLRFGTVSIRKLATEARKKKSEVWLSELIWREFFMQILFHFPHVVKESFRREYDKVAWRDDQKDFKKWCEGKTGYPLVDAGMRELNQTGFMHNRVRMVTASFLTKHLLIHWYKGERYFAEKLLDYDLSANNGNWQWAAGSGCDAAPYFRVFNPETQAKKFDPDSEYIKKWVPEYGTPQYVEPMIEHVFGRERALREYAKALKK